MFSLLFSYVVFMISIVCCLFYCIILQCVKAKRMMQVLLNHLQCQMPDIAIAAWEQLEFWLILLTYLGGPKTL